MRKESLSLTMPKLIMIVSLIVCAGAMIGVLGYLTKNKQVKIQQPQVSPATEPTKSVENETADWKTYRNEEYGFEVKYPLEFIFNSTGPNISQQAIDKGEQIAGSVAPSFNTIIFFGKNNGGEEKFYIDIFHPDERNISEKNYDDYMNVSGPCDTRWGFESLVKKMEKISNTNVLKVVGKTSRDSQVTSFIGCNYFKNQNNNLIVLNTVSNSENDFNETNAILQKVLSTLVLGNTANIAQESETTFLQSNNIWILSEDFKNKFKIVSSNETITRFSFSPDGKEIYWLNGKEIWKKDSNGRIKLLVKAGEINIEAIKKRWEKIEWVNLEEIDKLKGGVESFTLSPDGKYIAYEEIEDYTNCCQAQPNIPVTRIWIMKIDGSENVKINTPSGAERNLMVFDKWFPNSRKILFHFRASDEPTQGSPFFEIDVNGKNPKVYTAIYQDNFLKSNETITILGSDPVFSPDGTKMFYIEGWERLWLANINGTEKKMILETDFPMGNISNIIKWSGSGSSLSVATANRTFVFDKEGEIIFESE